MPTNAAFTCLTALCAFALQIKVSFLRYSTDGMFGLYMPQAPDQQRPIWSSKGAPKWSDFNPFQRSLKGWTARGSVGIPWVIPLHQDGTKRSL